MKLGEAKEIITRMLEWGPGYLRDDERQAITLGLEALADVEKDRVGSFVMLLPSETE